MVASLEEDGGTRLELSHQDSATGDACLVLVERGSDLAEACHFRTPSPNRLGVATSSAVRSTVSGLARPGVARVEVRSADGRSRSLPLVSTPNGASAVLGLLPTPTKEVDSATAYDRDSREVQTVPLSKQFMQPAKASWPREPLPGRTTASHALRNAPRFDKGRPRREASQPDARSGSHAGRRLPFILRYDGFYFEESDAARAMTG